MNAGIGVGETAGTLREVIERVTNDSGKKPFSRFKTEWDLRKTVQKPFYPSEVVWLLNERGIVSFLQGKLFDALPVFRLARRALGGANWANADVGEDDAPNSMERRIRLNEALAVLEYGKIDRARETFRRLAERLERGRRYRHGVTGNLAMGYLGLSYHQAGRYRTAEEHYLKALDFLEGQTRHTRAVAIFRRHLGDLYRKTGEFKSAKKYINLAISAASSAEQQDIYHFSLVSKAHLLALETGPSEEAFRLLNQAEQYADKLGLLKLKVDVCSTRGSIFLSQGQLSGAGDALTTAMAIANKNGMKLYKIRALISYGDLLERRDENQELINRVRAVAKAQADESGYSLRTADPGFTVQTQNRDR
ncbi:MAG: tetratricopeptide repeat protein [Chromatiaceae bacterium]|nr:tetratricopeptide repeat protein [Chromatiaceae bacterium]